MKVRVLANTLCAKYYSPSLPDKEFEYFSDPQQSKTYVILIRFGCFMLYLKTDLMTMCMIHHFMIDFLFYFVFISISLEYITLCIDSIYYIKKYISCFILPFQYFN